MNASASASTGVPTTYFEDLRDSTREANGRPVIKVPGYPGFVGLPHNLLYIIVKSDPAKRQTLTAKPGGFLRADIVGGVTIKYRAFFGEEAKRKEKREEHEDTERANTLQSGALSFAQAVATTAVAGVEGGGRQACSRTA